jgi:hypothetical protein
MKIPMAADCRFRQWNWLRAPALGSADGRRTLSVGDA